MANLNQIIGKLNEDYQATVAKDNGQAYSKLSTIFEELGKYLREYIQDITENDVRNIMLKLENGDTITNEDKEMLRLWLVGDAEYYTKIENDLGNWKEELKRLMGEINKLNIDEPDMTQASKLRALFRDGSRVLADIFYYTQQKERVDRFSESTVDIDAAEREILIKILEQKIASPDY